MGVEASLARLILADMNDFTSRNKLRLLRICKTLCPPDAAWKLGLVFVSMLSVDPLLYDLLGDSERPRATLADLCSHADSPLARAQARIADRLESWDAQGPAWTVFRVARPTAGRQCSAPGESSCSSPQQWWIISSCDWLILFSTSGAWHRARRRPNAISLAGR